jgi:carboxypeptidase Taq
MNPRAAYQELIRRSKEIALLASCAELLAWDEDTYMPPGGVENRARQLAYLAGLQHERATDPQLGDVLDELKDSELVRDPLSPEAVNVREMLRSFQRHARLPRELVEEMARVSSLAQHEWAVARQDADFQRFLPWLTRIISLKRREAESLGGTPVKKGSEPRNAKGPTPGSRGNLYDALLEDFEPGMTDAGLAQLFEDLRRELKPLAAALTQARRRPNLGILRRDYPVERQRLFSESVAEAVGFDFNCGRIDAATHPFFSTIGPGDTRLTTRHHPTSFGDGVFVTLHEVGHGLYDQGLDPDHAGTPMGDAASLAVHESQGRLWENLVGRSRSFWRHFFPRARRTFRTALADVALDQFYFAVNAVEATFIRVQADEVTYNLHILIRFELERALITEELKPVDLPDAWNRAYRHHLGITPANDADGCLQDGHWAAGQFGYFPTYTLGNVYAAQLFAAAERACGSFDEAFARGDFSGLLGWLRAQVHRQGMRYPAVRLIEQATGAPPDARPLVEGLRRKYGDLYGI